MIKKERLKKLIEQELKIYIYDKYTENYYAIQLNKENFLIVRNQLQRNVPLGINDMIMETVIVLYRLEDIYETKENIKWYLKFGNIKRTQTLSLPSWEEIFADKKILYNGIYNCYWLDNAWKYGIEICAYIKNNDFKNGQIRVNGTYFNGITKKNYLKACILARKLYLKEQKETNKK